VRPPRALIVVGALIVAAMLAARPAARAIDRLLLHM